MSAPDYLLAAYGYTGQAIMAWGRVEQRVIIQTWKSRDPDGKKPFTQGPIERGFYNRWREWCRVFDAPQSLRDKVLKLSDFRDDLSHNVSGIDEANGVYSLAVWRRHLDWRGSWQKWVDKFIHLPPRARPEQPVAQKYLRYGPEHVASFLDGLVRAQGEATRLVEARFHAGGYTAPSIPPFPSN